MILSHQNIQWQYLKKTHELQKMPHALLFYGKSSIGKKALALELIKLLNCQNEDLTKRPCQRCRTCQDIEKKVHPDLLLVEPEENREIKINQIRALHSHLSLRAYLAPFKAVIIDQAHCLNQEAQSAFLKLLEEPKGRTIFILITEYPEMLLPTILSRVERLRFYFSQKQIYSQQDIKKIQEISSSDLARRFQYAKELSEDSQNLKNILEIWLGYFRQAWLISFDVKLSKILKLLQTTHYLISTTNINPRLALEILFLEL